MMKFACYFCMVCAAVAADQPVKTQKPAAPVKTVQTLKLPPDATPLSVGRYRWTDNDGKVWIYRKTPFGISRYAENAGDPGNKAEAQETTAVEQGDSIKFTRSTPFGKNSWTRKKSDLDPEEQKIWEAHKQEKE